MDGTLDDLEAKVVILGDSGVGKTSLTMRFIKGQFDTQPKPTVGATHLSRKMTLDGISVKLNLWDTAGQERFRSLAPMYYRGAQSAVLVYDLTSQQTFDSVKQWVTELHAAMEHDLRTIGKLEHPLLFLLYLVGNKLDLEDGRQVSKEKAMQFANDVGAYFVEISARENIGIDDLFAEIAAGVIHQRQTAEESPQTLTIGWQSYPLEPAAQSKCCP